MQGNDTKDNGPCKLDQRQSPNNISTETFMWKQKDPEEKEQKVAMRFRKLFHISCKTLKKSSIIISTKTLMLKYKDTEDKKRCHPAFQEVSPH